MFWYRVDPRQFDSGLKLAMWGLLPAMLAQRAIENGTLDWLDPDNIYATFLTAYGDVQRAEDAQLQSMKLLIDSRCSHGSKPPS